MMNIQGEDRRRRHQRGPGERRVHGSNPAQCHAQEREAQCPQGVAAGGTGDRAVWASLGGFTEQVRFLPMGSRWKCIARGVKSTFQGVKDSVSVCAHACACVCVHIARCSQRIGKGWQQMRLGPTC